MNGVDQAASQAVAIVEKARTMEFAQMAVRGDSAVRMNGPGGTWILRMYQASGGRGSYHLNVRIPGRPQPVYSIAGIRSALESIFGIAIDATDADTINDEASDLDVEFHAEDTSAEAEDNQLYRRAALRIVSAYRAHRMRKCIATRIKARADVRSAQEDVVRAQVALASARIAVDGADAELITTTHRATESIIHEDAVRLTTPSITLIPSTKSFGTESIPVNGIEYLGDIISLVAVPFGWTRTDIVAHANGLIRNNSKKSMAYECGRSVLHSPHHPLIVGELPLPFYNSLMKIDVGDVPIYVQSLYNVSQFHKNALLNNFNPSWYDHIDNMMRQDVVYYDFFLDRFKREYMGSLVLSKMCVKTYGNFFPAMSIESIVAAKKGVGYGTIMLNLCKRILFSDNSVDTGYLFAQCLKIDFWNMMMDATMDAACLILQMDSIHPTYSYETRVVPRMSILKRYTHMPSP